MHRLIMKNPDNLDVDHIDGDRLDNQKSNLRKATQSQNSMNQKNQSGRSSNFKGVCWHTRDHKHQAYIKINQKRKHIGYFDSEIEAAKAYNAAAIKYFGEFARLNDVT